MTEQFAFHRIFRDRRAVERQIRFARARAGLMTGMSKQIFTGAGIAGNQQGRTQHRQFASLFDNMFHFAADGDDLAKSADILSCQILQLTPHPDS